MAGATRLQTMQMRDSPSFVLFYSQWPISRYLEYEMADKLFPFLL